MAPVARPCLSGPVSAAQAGADWVPSLALLQPEEQKNLYALSVAEEGLDVGFGLRPLHLKQLLDGQLEPISEGNSKQRLISPLYRMVVQVCKPPEHTHRAMQVCHIQILPSPKFTAQSGPLHLRPSGSLCVLFSMQAIKQQASQSVTM